MPQLNISLTYGLYPTKEIPRIIKCTYKFGKIHADSSSKWFNQ